MIQPRRLADKIQAFHQAHWLSAQEMLSHQARLFTWDHFLDLEQIVRPEGLSQACRGVMPGAMIRSFVLSPDVVVVDPEIPALCRAPYRRVDGALLACGGINHQRSACPPYAPAPEETLATLSRSRAVVVIQADGLCSYTDQKRMHLFLLDMEEHLAQAGYMIVGSWSAGPCRICEPEQECLGDGKCRKPKLRRYSMEACGMAVFALCERIASLSHDENWKLEIIENWGLPTQSRTDFKSVVAVAVK